MTVESTPPPSSGPGAAPSERGAETGEPGVGRHAGLTEDLLTAQIELARARSRPLSMLGDLLAYRLLSALSGPGSRLPKSMVRRFRRSAAKKDPGRSLPDNAGENAGEATRLAGSRTPDPARRTAVVVTAGAGLDGPPALALAIAGELAKRHNVVVVSLGTGALLQDFRAVSVSCWVAPPTMDDTSFLDNPDGAKAVDFAIVNSLGALRLLPALQERGIPTIGLMHEFASSYEMDETREFFQLCDEVVFSSEAALQDALRHGQIIRRPTAHVRPLQKVPSPSLSRAPEDQDRARATLDAVLRPVESAAFLVVGIGPVTLRTGPDLFIEVAQHATSLPDAPPCRFYWVGDGYAPDADYRYSAYLRDQMRRAGVEDCVRFLPATAETDHLFELADAVLLPGRLDPFPGAALDALSAGLPVLCFEGVNDIAEDLRKAGLAEFCVAPFYDAAGLAARVVALARHRAAYDDVSARARALAEARSGFAAYVAGLEELVSTARERRARRDRDAKIIENAASLRADTAAGKGRLRLTGASAIRKYMRRVAAGVTSTKPEPGFNPYIYADHSAALGLSGDDAYADFLRAGRPEGPWLTPVLTGPARPPKLSDLRAALHIHAYFPDMLAGLLDRLAANDSRPSLFVSVARPDLGTAAALLEAYDGPVGALESVPNIGRDIGPLLTQFGPRLVEGFDVVGHVHTKKSGHFSDGYAIEQWTEFLYGNLLGGPREGAMADLALGAFAEDAALGLVYPDDPKLTGWTSNLAQARELADALGLGPLPAHFNFPAGTMFWMRAAALEPFVALGLDWGDYPLEPLPHDGTSLHALERLFGVLPVEQGWSIATTNIPGLTR